jgi:ribosome biogenesis GTPase A
VAGVDAVGVIEGIAKKRGCLIRGRGGEFDIEKASLILLTDYRGGALGRISLETPETRAAMLAAAATPQSC